MHILSYPELDAACVSTIAPVPGYQHQLIILMELYYKTGIRPVEGVDPAKWSVDLMGNFRLITAKTGQVRTFDPAELPREFVDDILLGRWPFPNIRYSQAEQYFYKLFPYPLLRKGDRPSGLYAFRYRYVKGLKLDGYPNSQIQSKMAWSDPELVNRYSGASLVT